MFVAALHRIAVTDIVVPATTFWESETEQENTNS
jgi:hypothetical protein